MNNTTRRSQRVLYFIPTLLCALLLAPACGDDGDGGSGGVSLGLGAFNEDMQEVSGSWRCENTSYSGSIRTFGSGDGPSPTEAVVYLWDIENNTFSDEKARVALNGDQSTDAEFTFEGFACDDLKHAIVTVPVTSNAFGLYSISSSFVEESVAQGGGFFANNLDKQAEVSFFASKQVGSVTLHTVDLSSGSVQKYPMSFQGEEEGSFAYSANIFFSSDIDTMAKIAVVRDGDNNITELYDL